MQNCTCKADFSDVAVALKSFHAQTVKAMDDIGKEAVEYAKQNGNYNDRTGHLRASNKYEVSESGLRLYNDAEYASDVEASGYSVISDAALMAERRLKEVFE